MDEHSEHTRDVPSEDPIKAKQRPLRRLERHVWRRVGSGFLVLVPLIVTVWILYFVFSLVDGVFRGEGGILRNVIGGTPWDFWGLGVVITLVLFYITGAFLAGKRVRTWEDALLSKIPILGSIYSVSRQAIDALSSSKSHRFSRVVFVEWPRPGVRALGFVTGHLHNGIDGSSPIVVVYIPTVPNPTSGMLAWVPEEEVTVTDISVEDAMKAVFSGGIVLPEMPATKRIPSVLHVEEEVDPPQAQEIEVPPTEAQPTEARRP